MAIFLEVVQILSALVLIVLIASQTTKSEQSGAGGLGWGTIGGKASSSFSRWGLEEHLDRITTIVAVAFLVLSVLTAIAYFRLT
jgi:protein translocase SecG subunit